MSIYFSLNTKEGEVILEINPLDTNMKEMLAFAGKDFFQDFTIRQNTQNLLYLFYITVVEHGFISYHPKDSIDFNSYFRSSGFKRFAIFGSPSHYEENDEQYLGFRNFKKTTAQ